LLALDLKIGLFGEQLRPDGRHSLLGFASCVVLIFIEGLAGRAAHVTINPVIGHIDGAKFGVVVAIDPTAKKRQEEKEAEQIY